MNDWILSCLRGFDRRTVGQMDICDFTVSFAAENIYQMFD